MADFMTPDEVQAQAKLLYEQFDKGYINAKQLRDGLNDCAKGVQGYTQELNASLQQLGTSVKSTFEELKNGKQGSAVFNKSLNAGADAAAKAAMQFGPLGVAIGAVIKVLTFFVTAATDQADALYKANQDLAKIGAAGAGGMTEIYSNLKQFGYGISDLGDMSALLTQNSVSLSNFSGTVSQGAKALAGVANSIQSTDLQRQFMNMGYSVHDMNKGIGDYMSQQAAFGTSRKMTDEDLKIGAAEYLKNMSKLSKLTGQSSDDMAKQRNEALAIDSFNAALDSMDAEERENQLARYNALAKYDKEAAIGYANQVSGFIGQGKESQKLFMTTGGISNKLAKDTKMPLNQFMQSMADATETTHSLRKSQALMGNTETFLAYNKTQKLSNQANGEVLRAMQEATNQTNAQAAGADKLTDSATKTRQAQMSSRDAFENLLNKGILPVSEGIEALADLVDTVLHPMSLFTGGTERQKRNQEQAGYKAAAAATGTGVAADQTARGADIASKLQSRGFSETESAAIAGNLYAESAFKTGAINLASGASGLMQWTGARKDALKAYAKQRGTEWTDEGTQLDFIKKELKDDNGYEAKQFKKAMEEGAGNVAKSAYYFAKYVERPNASELEGSAAKRANMAAAISSRPLTPIAAAQNGLPVVEGPKDPNAVKPSDAKPGISKEAAVKIAAPIRQAASEVKTGEREAKQRAS